MAIIFFSTLNQSMNSVNSSQNNLLFTSRCPEVRDAQWVCQKVKNTFPHISTTKISAKMADIEEANWDLYRKFIDKPEYALLYNKNPKDRKFLRLFAWRKRIVKRIHDARESWRIGGKDDYHRVNNVLGQFKYDKLGNCGEDAFMAATILRINGVDNACTAGLKVDGSFLDHMVCVFNKDGSTFNGKPNKNTIIIDPWVGMADFASNMFQKYKNVFSELLIGIKPQSEITFRNVAEVGISGMERFLLIMKHPELCYPNSAREFMRKK